MRTISVIFMQGLFEFEAHGPDRIGKQVAPVVELFFEGSVSALYAAVVCRPAWRQNIERNRQL
jgi:hypothetical protein